MFQSLILEKEIREHPRVVSLCKRFTKIPQIVCDHYQEVFNPKAQNFRLQKEKPALILAKKFKNWVLPTPSGYGIGSQYNYYFSHMLNCIYDCRYCFLQGMYPSAHFVLFVNYEDFANALIEKIASHKNDTCYFFSGYDCDSLALEPITHFAEYFLPLFSQHPNAFLELRTKSTHISCLLKTPSLSNCIVSFTLSPDQIVKALEHKTPSLKRRLQAALQLQQQGWPIGLRFDPLIYSENFREIYAPFFQEVFSTLKSDQLHSVTLGLFRLPKPFFKNILKLYPDEKLFAHSLNEEADSVTYEKNRAEALRLFCIEQLMHYIPKTCLFTCES